MFDRLHVPHVGAPDPDKKTSPIADEGAEEFDSVEQASPATSLCFFNGAKYASGKYVCSGDTLLRCETGVWIREGTCDPDNP